MEARTYYSRKNPTVLPGADNPDPLESAPEVPDIEATPRYWVHVCPKSNLSGRRWHQDISGWGNNRVREGTPCALLCGYKAHRDTALLNSQMRPIALLGGRNMMSARLERWWMRCSVCRNTWRNYLEDHPFVKRGRADLNGTSQYGNGLGKPAPGQERVVDGTTPTDSTDVKGFEVAMSCASCAAPFSAFATEINQYGEEVGEVLKWDSKYYGAVGSTAHTLRRVPNMAELNKHSSP
ncbi:hypothetical protein MFIFM68171_00179 [Madurella fahalii]|uniref:Uncharacterized protein n=1 Tax=Madurella fahalii TaxID=1157608 RepID=A0ABQ0FWV5_9PEZI